jgi:hypothetical protein
MQGGGFGGFKASSTTLSYLALPPDFSAIPHEVVVPFKNLLKKDSTTKEKALQDILTYVQSRPPDAHPPEEPVIDAYVELYPRLSIDDSARARELSHQVLFRLLSHAKKRIAKRLPDFVGPWLAGTFDRDKRVSKAASDALSSFLPTKEKEEAFWKAVQNRALGFASEAVRETPDTLSDERSTTKQDSEAKYYRVVGASLSLVLNLVRRGDISSLQDGLASYLEVPAIWTMPSAEDPFVRRVFYQFLSTLLDTQPNLLEPRLQQIGRALISDGLKKSQLQSATDLLRALARLTRHFPQVWGTQKHILQRLENFVARGSQGGGEEFWRALDQLLQICPDKAPQVDVLSSFLAAMRKGIANRLESQASRAQGFQSYACVFDLFLDHFSPTTGFLEENLSSVTRQYLHPASDSFLPSPQRPDCLAGAWKAVSRHTRAEAHKAMAEEWQKLTSSFLSRISNSLPEVSDGYRQSQTGVASEGERWFALAALILSEEDDGGAILRGVLTTSSVEIMHGALNVLSRRNFKPFGAASVLQSAFKHCPRLCAEHELLDLLFPVDRTEVFDLIISSPSLPYLVSNFNPDSAGKGNRFEEIWTALLQAALRIPDRAAAISAVRMLIGIPSIDQIAQRSASLQSFLVSAWEEYTKADGPPSLRDLLADTLSFNTLTKESMTRITAEVVSALDAPQTCRLALSALELLLQKRPDLLPTDHNLHVDLLSHLLSLMELSDSTLSERAKGLRRSLDQQSTGQNPLPRIIEKELDDAGPSSLEYALLLQIPLSPVS